jgi:hypothetical protein
MTSEERLKLIHDISVYFQGCNVYFSGGHACNDVEMEMPYLLDSSFVWIDLARIFAVISGCSEVPMPKERMKSMRMLRRGAPALYQAVLQLDKENGHGRPNPPDPS